MKIRINITVDADELRKFDSVIGDVPRSAYLRRLMNNEIGILTHEKMGVHIKEV